MFFKSIMYLATTAVLAGGGYVALKNAAPSAAAKISGIIYENILGWDDAACEENPLGCLTSRYTTLQKLEKQVGSLVEAISAQKERITTLVDEQQLLVAKNASFLEEGKVVFRASAPQPESPITFAGKTYPNANTFRQQLALLFQEKAGLEASLSNAMGLQNKLKDRLDGLMVQSGDITLAKRMLPAQIELVKANITLADFGSSVAAIDSVIKGSETGLKDTDLLIRTTKDLMDGSSNTPTVPQITNKALDEYLAR